MKIVNIADSVTIKQATATLRREGNRHSAGFTGIVKASSLVIGVSSFIELAISNWLRRSCKTLLVLPVRVFRVFQVPERAAAVNFGQRFKVVFRRRRGRGPFGRPGVPRIITRPLPFSQR